MTAYPSSKSIISAAAARPTSFAYGFRAVQGSLRAMEQAIPKSNARLFAGRVFFRIIDRVPLFKRWMFRGTGDE